MASSRSTANHPTKRAAEGTARPQVSKPEKAEKRSRRTYLDTVVEVGSSIDFPTGETLRVTRIEKDRITLEKTP